jgi:UDP-N-acetylmuramoyl-L-alanyl-D-glutamate--2,6-diaminopimelate ligase
MRLRDLLPLSPAAGRLGDVEVRGVAVDSRRVRPGDVFFALAGSREDGRRPAPAAPVRCSARPRHVSRAIRPPRSPWSA